MQFVILKFGLPNAHVRGNGYDFLSYLFLNAGRYFNSHMEPGVHQHWEAIHGWNSGLDSDYKLKMIDD